MTIWCGKCGGGFTTAEAFSAHGCAPKPKKEDDK